MIIDLFCGIGRFEREGVNVVSIDSDPKTKPTILADIRFLPLRARIRPDLVHASPPCTYFSVARARFMGWSCEGIAETLELVAAAYHAFHHLEAKNWTLENPIGYLGKLFNQTRIEHGGIHDYTHKPTNYWSDMRGLRRAIIPQDVRQKILDEAFKGA